MARHFPTATEKLAGLSAVAELIGARVEELPETLFSQEGYDWHLPTALGSAYAAGLAAGSKE